jgi:hypothetical protein
MTTAVDGSLRKGRDDDWVYFDADLESLMVMVDAYENAGDDDVEEEEVRWFGEK